MEIKQIKELMGAMGRTGIGEMSIKKDGFELHLKREQHPLANSLIDADDETFLRDSALHRAALSTSSRNEIAPLGVTPGIAPPSTSSKEEVPGIYVTSPMVGTFYSASSPDDAPFVKAGDKIEKNTVVCIIEAMKVMNEVKAGVSGTVAEVLVEAGHPVEFGTKLFKLI